MPDCDHIITTNPEVIKDEFPIIYDLCTKGAKFRIQAKVAAKTEFYEAIDKFRINLERKYGNNDYELLSWSQVLKSLLKPLIEIASNDKLLSFNAELKLLWKKYIITQVDKVVVALPLSVKK